MQDKQITWIYSQWRWDFWFVDDENTGTWYYVFWRNSLNTLPWDKVLATVKVFRWKEEATIEKVLERRTTPIIWKIQLTKTFGFVVPTSTLFKTDIFIPWKYLGDAKDGDVVWIEIIDWEWKNPTWKIIKNFKNATWRWIDILLVALEAWAKIDFDEKTLREARALDKNLSKNEIEKRVDLTNILTVTIDWEDSKDLDDAISVKKYSGWDYLLQVSIADVSHYVKENTALDFEAQKRWNSIYLVDKVIPMLPEILSNDLCSLNPDTKKLTLTAEMLFSCEWVLKNTKILNSIITSDFRLTYKEVDAIVSWELKSWDKLFFWKTLTSNLIKMLNESRELMIQIRNQRLKQWYMQFDFPECKIKLDDTGFPIAYESYPKYESNQIVEHFMIAANNAISQYMWKLPFVYRTHESPDIEDLSKLDGLLGFYWLALPKNKKVTSLDFSNLLNQISWKPYEKFLSKILLRAMQKAKYSEKSLWHFWLWLDFYSHFTSPIRRYADLQIHRIIKDYLAKKLDKKAIIHYKTILPKICTHISQTEIKAEKLEYKIRDMFACKFMSDKIWNEFDAEVSWMIEKWFFIALENTIEWMISFEKCSEKCFYEQDKMQVKFNNLKTLMIWDKVKVKLVEIDEKKMCLNFDLI